MLTIRTPLPNGQSVEAQIEIRDTAVPCPTCASVGTIGPLADGKTWPCPNCHGEAAIPDKRVGKVILELVYQEYQPGDDCGPTEDRYLMDGDVWEEKDVTQVNESEEYAKLRPISRRWLDWQLAQLVAGEPYHRSMLEAVREGLKEPTVSKNVAYSITRELKEAGILRKICHLRWRLVKPSYSSPSENDLIEETKPSSDVQKALGLFSEAYQLLLDSDEWKKQPTLTLVSRRRKGANCKLSHADVREIRELTPKRGTRTPGLAKKLAEKYQVSEKSIRNVWSNKTHYHVV